jgi:hypothetical protein
MNPAWTFKTVIAYHTYASAIRAKETAERLAGQMECEVDAWPFGQLAVRWIREQAIEVAAAADMIILAADGALELPRSEGRPEIDSSSPINLTVEPTGADCSSSSGTIISHKKWRELNHMTGGSVRSSARGENEAQ